MGKVFLVDIQGEFGVRGLIGDGKLLKFHFNGNCLGEFPIDYNLAGMQEVDIVSVLVSDNNVEVGYSVGQEFSAKTTLLGLADIVRVLNNQTGLIFSGRREGKESGVSYNQYIYAFLKNSVTANLLH